MYFDDALVTALPDVLMYFYGIGAHKVQELEMLVSQYEADKSRLVGEIAELKREIGDKETQNTSFESRITQRNSQLIELQEQINHKCTEISNLEREVLSALAFSLPSLLKKCIVTSISYTGDCTYQ